MKFYKVSYIDSEDNCTWKLFSNKKDAEKFIKTDGHEYGDVISTEPCLLVLPSTRKADILQLINGLCY
jgi:hypothetical protein